MSAPIGAPRLDELGGPGHALGDSGSASAKGRTDREAKHLDAKADPGRTSESQSLYVANIPWSATSDDLESLFAGHGKVIGATVIMDRKSGRSRGFGFVDMTGGTADRAIAALNGSTMSGRSLKVRMARPTPRRG